MMQQMLGFIVDSRVIKEWKYFDKLLTRKAW